MDYFEKSFDGKKSYHLGEDSISVKGTVFLTSNYESEIKFADLTSNTETLYIRSKSFFSALWMALVGFITPVVLIEAFHLSFTDHSVILFNIFGVSGVLMMLATYKKIKHVQFRNSNGIPILAVGKSGPDKGKFDEFIEVIKSKIVEKNIT